MNKSILSDRLQFTEELIKQYHSYQHSLPIKLPEDKLKDLVRFNSNKITPIHRWFTFKEGFSHELLSWLSSDIPLQTNRLDTLLDPFCGSGTSLLSAQMDPTRNKRLKAIGLEHNPLIQFVADAKLSWTYYDTAKIKKLIPELISKPDITSVDEESVPVLSTIRNPRVFKPHVIRELIAYRDQIINRLSNDDEAKFFLLGWIAILEKMSGVRKDGRALRFKEKGELPSVKQVLKQQWELMISDIQEADTIRSSAMLVSPQIIQADGRKLDAEELNGIEFDLIFYSPPYLNNIDYSEVYKIELWLSGFIKTHEDFRQLRLGTLRSHPSIKFPDTTILDNLPVDSWPRRLCNSIIHAFPQDEDHAWRERMVRGYVEDMYVALLSQFRVSKRNAPVVCVVGNSLHGHRPDTVPIATDLIICSLAQYIGFDIVSLQIARQLPRRDHGNDLLRESIIVMRHPK
jgi:DNA modification methylase